MNGYILVVDDQPSVRFVIEEILRYAGYKIKSATNGWECLNITRAADKPSLIILDYKMPFMNGIEVLAILKKDKTTQHIPVIMFTATDDVEETAKISGAHEVLTKPMDISKLEQIVDKILNKNACMRINSI